MKKQITNIFINSAIVSSDDKVEKSGRIYSYRIDTPPIIIKNKANLKVANICHSGTGHENNIIIFKTEGIMSDNNYYISNDGAIPIVIATTFNNTRNLYEENDIPLIKQTINSIKLIVSDSLTNPNAGIANTLNFCISLKIEEEVNE